MSSEDTMTPRRGWHLSREVQVTHLLATLSAVAACFWFVAGLDSRLQLQEAATKRFEDAQRERDQRQDESTAEALKTLRRQLDKMDDKLDRLLAERAVSAGGRR